MFLDKKTVLKVWLNLGPRYQNFYRARVLGYFWGVRRRANQRVAIVAWKKRSGTLPFVYIIQFLSASFFFHSTMASAEVPESFICRELYDHQNLFPRLLSCSHSFCTSCLKNLLKNNSISSPDCRKTASVPTGVAGLTLWSLRYLNRQFFLTNPPFCCL